jgi:hypothetical protein
LGALRNLARRIDGAAERVEPKRAYLCPRGTLAGKVILDCCQQVQHAHRVIVVDVAEHQQV